MAMHHVRGNAKPFHNPIGEILILILTLLLLLWHTAMTSSFFMLPFRMSNKLGIHSCM
ncbi:hypothetical protein JOC55_003295 [Paenibacillus sacheonensis]|nr:hypothetical protein [Paenibacillus sacheonensis]